MVLLKKTITIGCYLQVNPKFLITNNRKNKKEIQQEDQTQFIFKNKLIITIIFKIVIT